ncbi:MAG: polyprenyl synthetase family protein, partial [Candidatus Korarchaeota archaeon]|nr:polyprenyl synthetase family protein [Candidatus Korarchaeota archaeon]
GVNPFPAAVAVELAHMESLIHDDIIDRDHLRRGQLAFHDSYGYEMALLSADFLLSMILEITSRSADPRIAETLAQETCRMCEGELEEIRVCKSGHEIGMDEYIGIISKKTASLFEASAKIGAIIGGAQEHEIEALSSYGKHLGIAYQIRDDITDLKKKPFNILNLLGV